MSSEDAPCDRDPSLERAVDGEPPTSRQDAPEEGSAADLEAHMRPEDAADAQHGEGQEKMGDAANEPDDAGLPVQESDGSIRFQLIPVSDTPGRAPIGEVVERRLKDGQLMRIGRQVMRDGQATIKGNKPATEIDVWFTSKVVSRLHGEMWVKDSQLYVKDIGSSSGTFLNKMRLSPSNKESRPYPLKEGDVIQFGVDYKGKTEDMYKCVMLKIGFFDQSWIKNQKKNANPVRFTAALKALLAATNPYASSSQEEGDSTSTECCICIGSIAPFQALFIAPCSHCYHYKCVATLVVQSAMFQCPLCRQVANLTASVSSDSLHEKPVVYTAEAALAAQLAAEADKADDPLDSSLSNSRAQANNRPLSAFGGPAAAAGGSGQSGIVKSSTATGGFFASLRRQSIQHGHDSHAGPSSAASGANAPGSGAQDQDPGHHRRKSFVSKAEHIFEAFKFGRKQSIDHSARRANADQGANRHGSNEAEQVAQLPETDPGSSSSGGQDGPERRGRRRTLSMKLGSLLRPGAPSNAGAGEPLSGAGSQAGSQGQMVHHHGHSSNAAGSSGSIGATQQPAMHSPLHSALQQQAPASPQQDAMPEEPSHDGPDSPQMPTIDLADAADSGDDADAMQRNRTYAARSGEGLAGLNGADAASRVPRTQHAEPAVALRGAADARGVAEDPLLDVRAFAPPPAVDDLRP